MTKDDTLKLFTLPEHINSVINSSKEYLKNIKLYKYDSLDDIQVLVTTIILLHEKIEYLSNRIKILDKYEKVCEDASERECRKMQNLKRTL